MCDGAADGFSECFPSGQKTFIGDGERLRAGKADDGQSALAEWRGNGGDGVVEHGATLQVEGLRLQAGVFALEFSPAGVGPLLPRSSVNSN